MYKHYQSEEILTAARQIKIPESWKWDETGIYHCASDHETRISATPVVIIAQLVNIKNNKVKYELAYKMHGTWYTIVCDADFMQVNKITSLAIYGINITSNNAAMLVRYFEAMHKVNETSLCRKYVTDCCGWQNDHTFIPGVNNDINLDIDEECQLIAEGYRSAGNIDEWIALMGKLRENHRFRFILAASAAAPLLRVLSQRSFFVYSWGTSRAGKTAALKAALSIWGHPEEIMGSFNTTQVGLEYMAALFNDLPLGLDERQLAGKKQQEKLESIVYMISAGRGRWRGKKEGGVQKVLRWRTVVIATGEEPLGTEMSQNGVSTRIVELIGTPIKNERDAAKVHQLTEVNYGQVGELLARYYVNANKNDLNSTFRYIVDNLSSSEMGGAYITNVSVVALADAILQSLLFAGGRKTPETLTVSSDSLNSAIKLGFRVLEDTKSYAAGDVNANAVQYICDWIISHQYAFDDDYSGAKYGYSDGDVYYIIPACLDESLRRAGYNPQKTRLYLTEKGLITKTERNGTVVNTVVKRHGGTTSRYIEFKGLQLLQ